MIEILVFGLVGAGAPALVPVGVGMGWLLLLQMRTPSLAPGELPTWRLVVRAAVFE
jgi:hypothetical protein